MSDDTLAEEWFEATIDGDRVWHTDGYGEEYDVIHFVAGALLAGAETVEVRRESDETDGPPEITDEERAEIPTYPADQMGAPEYSSDSSTEDGDADDDADEGGVEDPPEIDDESRDIDTLVALDRIGRAKIRALREDGFETLADIREASVSDVKQHGVISFDSASRITDFAHDVLDGGPDDREDGSDSEPNTGTEADEEGGDESTEDGEPAHNGTGAEDLEPLDPEEVEMALAELDVPHGIEVSDVVQAVDGNRQCFRVGRALDTDRPTAEVLIGKLGLKPALKSDDGLCAKRLNLAANGGEAA